MRVVGGSGEGRVAARRLSRASSSLPCGGVSGTWRRLHDHQRAHHVVLFVLQDVAVPHVLVAAGPRAGGNGERHRRQVELHDHRRDLAGVHLHRLLPAQSRFGPGRGAGPVYAGCAVVGRPTLNGCRERTCTLTRWKWIGCVSPVRLAICQTSSAPALRRLRRRVQVRRARTCRGSTGCVRPQQLDQAAVVVEVLVEGQLADRDARAVAGRPRIAGPERHQQRVDALASGRCPAVMLQAAGPCSVAGTTLKRMICRVFGPKPGVGCVGIVRRAGEVVVERVAHRERRRRVVVEDDLLAREAREVDDHVPALGRGGDQAARLEASVGIERHVGLARRTGCGQEAALGADHEEVGALGDWWASCACR